MIEIPVIDLGEFIAGDAQSRRGAVAKIDAACRDIGFLVVSGHGVADGLISRMHEISTEFFALPSEHKRKLVFPIDNDIGYKTLGNSYLSNTMDGDAGNASAADWKESFGARPCAAPQGICNEEVPYFAFNAWPSELPRMRTIYTEYFAEMTRVSDTLMAAFAVALGLDGGYFQDKIDRHLSSLVVHHYPPQTVPPQPGQMRAGAHTDFGSLTVLHTGHNPHGLQVLHDDQWIDVVPAWDHFVVNIGDLMTQWSNDRWKSTLHRVVNPTPERAHLGRQSLTFFHSPNWHTWVDCLPNCANSGQAAKYPPVKAGPYVEEKLAKLRDPLPV